MTGDDIISELIRNMESGAFKIRYTTLVPCIFNVYLHPEDFEQVRPVERFLKEEARQALNEHLANLNRTTLLTKALSLGQHRQPEYKILEPDWRIELLPDVEDRLARGDIEIYSELGSGQKAEFGAGAMTTFITRKAPEPVPAPQAPAAPEQPRPDKAVTARTGRQVFAYLRYRDDAGDKTFPVTRDQTVIGRGGKSFWVDLRLDGPPDISREHCRIRRDPATGSFFIKDLSQYGTAVDGRAIPSSLDRTPAGERVDRNIEVPLPERSKITLADVLTVEFEAAIPE